MEENLTKEKELHKSSEPKSLANLQCRSEKRSLEDNGITELPAELKKMFKPLSCELCNVTVTSPLIAYSHYEGKLHIKNVNNYMKKNHNVESALKKQKTEVELVKCDVCNIELASNLVYKMHLTGKKHRKNLKKNQDLPPSIKVEVDPTGRFNIGKAFLNETAQPIPEQSSDLFCDICQVFSNTKTQMAIHKQGQKHAKKVARNEIKQNTNINMAQNEEDEEDVWQVTPDDHQNSS